MRRGPKLFGYVSCKIRCIFIGLEPYQIVACERAQSPFVVGHRSQHFGGRHRNMQEEADPVVMTSSPQFLSERQ